MDEETQTKYELRIIEKDLNRKKMITELEEKHGITGKNVDEKVIEVQEKQEAIKQNDTGKEEQTNELGVGK